MGTPQGVEAGHEGRLVLETGIDKIRVLKKCISSGFQHRRYVLSFRHMLYLTIKMNIDWLIHLRYLEYVDMIFI